MGAGQLSRASADDRHSFTRLSSPAARSGKFAPPRRQCRVPKVICVGRTDISGPGWRLPGLSRLAEIYPIAVIDEALQSADSDRSIYLAATASGLARRPTNPAARGDRKSV